MAVLRPAARGINFPHFRCCSDQHRSRRGAGFPQSFPLGPGARAAAGHLNPVRGVVVSRVNRRGFDPDLAPIGVEFFGHEHRERGIDSLAHFAVAGDHRDGIIRADADERVGRKGRGFWLRSLSATAQPGQVNAENEAPASNGDRLEKITPADIDNLFHLPPP